MGQAFSNTPSGSGKFAALEKTLASAKPKGPKKYGPAKFSSLAKKGK